VSDDPRALAAASLRRLGNAMLGHEAAPELLRRVAAAADRVSDDLEAQPPRERDLRELKRRMFLQDVADGDVIVHFDECFVSGPWNPMGIGMQVHRERDEAVASVELGPAFEGAPGRSHGGVVAAIFDDVLGYLLTFQRTPAFTGELTVRYLAATPIGQPLQFRARVVGVEGRKIRAEGEAYALAADGDRGAPVATATGLFIAIARERIRD
jgi:acyl-coenzyme A thioesterase PaaI-like protein